MSKPSCQSVLYNFRIISVMHRLRNTKVLMYDFQPSHVARNFQYLNER